MEGVVVTLLLLLLLSLEGVEVEGAVGMKFFF